MTMSAVQPTGSEPSLSVIVASQNAHPTIVACLAAVEAQRGSSTETELIVVDNSRDGTVTTIKAQFPHVRVIREASPLFIPQLWGRGIRESQGAIVVLTTAHAVPRHDWLERIRSAYDAAENSPATSVCVGIGGAIENDEHANALDWAVYFCRYTAFMPPFVEGPRAEIAADNASYPRWALDGVCAAWQDGFWEPKVHAALRTQFSGQLIVKQDIVVYHTQSFGFVAFVGERFQHGLHYGHDRIAAETASFAKRAARIATGPLLPFLLLFRAARLVLGKRRYITAFLRAFPLLFVFFFAWSLGEWLGYCLPNLPARWSGAEPENDNGDAQKVVRQQ